MTPRSNWRVTDVAADRRDMVVHVDFTPVPMACPKCGSARRPRRYGNLEVDYRDAPFLGNRVKLRVGVRRFRCHDCGHAFFQDLTDMDGRRRMTARCVTYAIDQVMARSSLRDVAQIIGVDEKTVRNLFDDRGVIFTVGDPPSDDRFVCECCLGIHFRKDQRLAPPGHFGRWLADELRKDANVCVTCLGFARDAWRTGMVRRYRPGRE